MAAYSVILCEDSSSTLWIRPLFFFVVVFTIWVSQGSALLAAYILSSTFCSFSFYYFSDFGSYILLIQYVFILKITAS